MQGRMHALLRPYAQHGAWCTLFRSCIYILSHKPHADTRVWWYILIHAYIHTYAYSHTYEHAHVRAYTHAKSKISEGSNFTHSSSSSRETPRFCSGIKPSVFHAFAIVYTGLKLLAASFVLFRDLGAQNFILKLFLSLHLSLFPGGGGK